VRRVYERQLETMAEENTQLCVYYKGERVVDLWASTGNDPNFSADSLINVFSSGKSLAAIAIASLVGDELLAYETRLVDVWPEFGGEGKDDLTVADVMRHEGGMAAFRTSIDPEDLLIEKIKQNRVGKIIEDHPVRFREGTPGQREYHAVTRGWILNEVFRRVDPKGRTIGQFLKEELRDPLGADAVIGVEQHELQRISPLSPLGLRFELIESLRPRALGRRVPHHFFQILGRVFRVLPWMRRATTRGAPAPFTGMRGVEFFNEPVIAMGETPSAAATCSARGLGKIAAMMAARGTWEGKEYLRGSGWDAMHANPVLAEMGFSTTRFTQGGVNAFVQTGAKSSRLDSALNQGREGFYGWMGLGGSLFQWHPEHEIGFAFVPTALHVLDIVNERGKVYQAAVLRCVRELGER